MVSFVSELTSTTCKVPEQAASFVQNTVHQDHGYKNCGKQSLFKCSISAKVFWGTWFWCKTEMHRKNFYPTKDIIIGSEKLPKWACSNRIHCSRFQVHQTCTWNILTTLKQNKWIWRGQILICGRAFQVYVIVLSFQKCKKVKSLPKVKAKPSTSFENE